ncbi:hypothetical protein [Salirhabdus salicampi]|uniref:hypothetical protein n=1 Tax=Salirhabdus salicampi TaxID=476102 RepID=UPI0020C31328|nr:hypothetical protein [Salirhabdus salicampi]MCP8616065.1 hypothetical protein [Salirhabdus salicampi]
METKKITNTFICLMLLLTTSSCVRTEASVDVVLYQPYDFDVLLFSNKQNYQVEESYINAMLTLQRKTTKNETVWKQTIMDTPPNISIQEYPTLIIMKDQQILMKISGPKEKQDILAIISEIIVEDDVDI